MIFGNQLRYHQTFQNDKGKNMFETTFGRQNGNRYEGKETVYLLFHYLLFYPHPSSYLFINVNLFCTIPEQDRKMIAYYEIYLSNRYAKEKKNYIYRIV